MKGHKERDGEGGELYHRIIPMGVSNGIRKNKEEDEEEQEACCGDST